MGQPEKSEAKGLSPKEKIPHAAGAEAAAARKNLSLEGNPPPSLRDKGGTAGTLQKREGEAQGASITDGNRIRPSQKDVRNEFGPDKVEYHCLNNLLRIDEHLSPEVKKRALDNTALLNACADLSQGEKEKCFYQASRLLIDNASSIYSPEQCGQIADQLIWNMAHPERTEQGSHPSCPTNPIRSCLMYEQPSLAAKLIVDVATTGQYITADGTIIRPKADSLKPGREESNFNPQTAYRTLPGQIWDVTAANIYWQRKQGLSNGVRTDHSSTVFTTDGTMDIYQQITGKDERGRILIARSAGGLSNKDISRYSNFPEFQTAMSRGPWPKILAVHTSQSPFFEELGSPSANSGKLVWHNVVIPKPPQQNGMTQLDNSWLIGDDHIAPNKQMSLAAIYNATLGPVSRVRQPQFQNYPYRRR